MKQKILTLLLLLLCSVLSVKAQYGTVTGTSTFTVGKQYVVGSGSDTYQIKFASPMVLNWSNIPVNDGIHGSQPWSEANTWRIERTSSSGVSFEVEGYTANSIITFRYDKSGGTKTWEGYVTAGYDGVTYKAYIRLTFSDQDLWHNSDVHYPNNIHFNSEKVTQYLSNGSLTYTQGAISSSPSTKMYSISPSSGATINSSTGQVTITQAGTYTITCSQGSYWDGKHTYYDAGSASYTLIVQPEVAVIHEYYKYNTSPLTRWLTASQVITATNMSESGVNVRVMNVDEMAVDGNTKTINMTTTGSGSTFDECKSIINGQLHYTIPEGSMLGKASYDSDFNVYTTVSPTTTNNFNSASNINNGYAILHPRTEAKEYQTQVTVKSTSDYVYKCVYISSPNTAYMNAVSMKDGDGIVLRGQNTFSIADLRTDGLAGETTYSVVSATGADGMPMIEGEDYTINPTTGEVVAYKAATFMVMADFAGNSETGYFPATATAIYTIGCDFWSIPSEFSKPTSYVETAVSNCHLIFGEDSYGCNSGTNDDPDFEDIPENGNVFTHYTKGTQPANGDATTIPTSGTFYKFESSKEGYLLTVGIKLEKRCKFYLLDHDKSAGTITSLKQYGSELETWNGANGTVNLFTKANHDYYFFSTDEPLGLYGFQYSENQEGYYESNGFLKK